MNISHFLFAAVEPLTRENSKEFLEGSDWGLVLVAAASCLVGLLAVLGTVLYYTRRQRRRPHHHHHHRPHREESGNTSSNQTSPTAEAQSGERERLRRRRRRRNHRPRNPTLAETGGLPPVRKDSPPGP